jgi:hypothetical protein
VETLGRGVRGELGSFHTVDQALAAAGAPPRGVPRDASEDAPDDGDAESALRLARAAALRAEALGGQTVGSPTLGGRG